MISREEAKKLINDLFEEEALVVGGMAAIHEIEDDLVWRLIKNFDVIRSKILRRLGDKDSTGDEGVTEQSPDVNPHPAIQEFLMKLRRT